MKYASDTTVSVARTKAEIEELLTRYGADQFGSAVDHSTSKALIQFRLKGIMIAFELPLPLLSEHAQTRRGRERSEGMAERAWEQACRSRWRALLLVIKAKLEAVESQIVTFESEFLANIVMPDGRTFGDWARPQIRQMIEDHKMPTTLMIEARNVN